MSHQICLAHELFPTASDGANVISPAIRFVGEHVLVVIVPSCEPFLRTEVAAVCSIGRIRVPTVANSCAGSRGDSVGRLCAPRPRTAHTFFRWSSLVVAVVVVKQSRRLVSGQCRLGVCVLV